MKLKQYDVLKIRKGQLVLGEEIIKASELKALYEQVENWRTFRLREILYTTLKQYAIDEGFIGSTTWEATRYGKAMVDCIGRMEEIEKRIEQLYKGQEVK